MNFIDKESPGLDLRDPRDLSRILSCLCAERVNVGCTESPPWQRCQSCMNWTILEKRLRSEFLSLEQFNDTLLLSNQRPIGRAFFERFFQPIDGKGSQVLKVL
jgi:hypothetical protein